MAFDSKSITFVAVFGLLVARDAEPSKPLMTLKATLSGPAEPPRRQQALVPIPLKKVGESMDVRPRRKRDPREPGQYDLVIYNTDRIPSDYTRAMLMRVFHESARSAQVKALFPHIHKGPYTREVAQTKALEVRCDAFDHGAPIPVLRYKRHI